ncbi:hypothetical protein B296_00031479 [Ensete ventricosum]|uniref:Uncharacterized protein n=1 Tax=Ensete ventricosum TaxID=4639 RepID=A0A427AG80_ENSVE|nr:hypothetical protein B296_00031479 [Ensete ventricosum]
MTDALSLIPASVLRNLADKLYEKRKNAALEVFWPMPFSQIEGIVKQLAVAREHEKISALINVLITEFAYSPQANHRKVGFGNLKPFRYYACEALYNIAKDIVTDSDQFRCTIWAYLINEFVRLGGEQLVPHYADILGAILPCISDKEEKIRVVSLAVVVRNHLCNKNTILITSYAFHGQVARETNEELRAIRADPADGFNIDAILSIARRCIFQSSIYLWNFMVITYLNHTYDSLLSALSDSSDEVLLRRFFLINALNDKHFI